MAATNVPVTIINQAPVLGAPFWTLVGAVLAAVIAGTFLLWNERQKREVDATVKDRDRELEACVNLLTEVTAYYDRTSSDAARDTIGGKLFYVQILADQTISDLALKYVKCAYISRLYNSHDKASSMSVTSTERAMDWYHFYRITYINLLRGKYGLDALPVKEHPSEPEPMFSVYEADMHAVMSRDTDDTMPVGHEK